MTTIREMIETHNDLAATIGLPAIATWKQAGDKLQARIDAMQAQADMENGVNDAAILAEGEAFVTQRPIDPLAIPEAFGDIEPDQVSPIGAEEPGGADQEPVDASEPVVESSEAPTESTKATKVAKGSIGKLVASLLLDAEGFDYPSIVEIVRGEFPDAQTSTRSIASVAAALRRSGVEVPMRRKAKSAEA